VWDRPADVRADDPPLDALLDALLVVVPSLLRRPSFVRA
jgi:hypothetical protein